LSYGRGCGYYTPSAWAGQIYGSSSYLPGFGDWGMKYTEKSPNPHPGQAGTKQRRLTTKAPSLKER